jgi:hypothetical protein
MLRTFNCNGCEAGFTVDGNFLVLTVAYHDQNSDVSRLFVTLRNIAGTAVTLPVITTQTNPALPTGSRGFALKVRLNIGDFGPVESVDVQVEDSQGNSARATLPDRSNVRNNATIQLNQQNNNTENSVEGIEIESIEKVPQP